jgi:hypothetical protein
MVQFPDFVYEFRRAGRNYKTRITAGLIQSKYTYLPITIQLYFIRPRYVLLYRERYNVVSCT